MRRVTHERCISQSQRVNCDLARRYVGLGLSHHHTTTSTTPDRLRQRIRTSDEGFAMCGEFDDPGAQQNYQPDYQPDYQLRADNGVSA